MSFTQFDPFEDTERRRSSLSCRVLFRFTQFDPFEDTERQCRAEGNHAPKEVSPNSIRSRILKDPPRQIKMWFCNVSPNSIRSRILKDWMSPLPQRGQTCFTQFDPFEDTERWSDWFAPITTQIVSPNSIRSRILKVSCFNSSSTRTQWFHPIRSVRGY